MHGQDKTFDKWKKGGRKICCVLEAITPEKEWPCSTSGYSSTSTLAFLFPCLWWREESQALWPLTLCVRRETCVSLWLPLWQTEECMSFTVLENRLRQPQKKLILSTSLLPPSYSHSPPISAAPPAIKRFLTEKHWGQSFLNNFCDWRRACRSHGRKIQLWKKTAMLDNCASAQPGATTVFCWLSIWNLVQGIKIWHLKH